MKGGRSRDRTLNPRLPCESKNDKATSSPLTLLLKISQIGRQAMPPGVITKESLSALIRKVTNVVPLDITVMNDVDSIIEFTSKIDVFEVAKRLHSVNRWQQYRVNVAALMATKTQVLTAVMPSKQTDGGVQRKRSAAQRQKLQGLLERIDSCTSKELLTKTPLLVESIPEVMPRKQQKPPKLPQFSGKIPVPNGEASFEQYMFQIQGFRTTYTDRAVRLSIVDSVRAEARDHLDYLGCDKELDVLIKALEQRFRPDRILDVLRKDYFHSSQLKGESIFQFARRLEIRYKAMKELSTQYTNEYDLKERLFQGMTKNLKKTVRFCHADPETTYEDLLQLVVEVENERMDQQALGMRVVVPTEDPGTSEEARLKEQLKKSTRTTKQTIKEELRRKGPEITAHGPFREGRKPVQCYQCHGWGHVKKECPTSGNEEWEMLHQVVPLPRYRDLESLNRNINSKRISM